MTILDADFITRIYALRSQVGVIRAECERARANLTLACDCAAFQEVLTKTILTFHREESETNRLAAGKASDGTEVHAANAG